MPLSGKLATKESLIQFLTEHLIKASMREKQMALCSNLVEVFQHSHIHVSVKEILDHEIPFIQIDITMTFPSAAIPSNRDPPICASFCINSKIHVTEVINANILTCNIMHKEPGNTVPKSYSSSSGPTCQVKAGCKFCNILPGTEGFDILYEVLLKLRPCSTPQADTHLLIIPKKHISKSS